MEQYATIQLTLPVLRQLCKKARNQLTDQKQIQHVSENTVEENGTLRYLTADETEFTQAFEDPTPTYTHNETDITVLGITEREH
jgi:hypothetical protein